MRTGLNSLSDTTPEEGHLRSNPPEHPGDQFAELRGHQHKECQGDAQMGEDQDGEAHGPRLPDLRLVTNHLNIPV